ncbi:MAG: glycogen-binding domain-containing protein [Endomicrobia bacterium]|nr:glycogen-binding domain-containing protein [Endomicrobiia bacterium]
MNKEKFSLCKLIFVTIFVAQTMSAQEYLIQQEEILPKVCIPEVTPVGIKFIYFNPDATKVTLAGDFTDWANKQLVMQKDEKGYFTRIVNLKEGEYEYKYIIDGSWMPGENIKLRVYKDPQEGKLKVEQKEIVQEKYSQKIFFFGKIDLSSKFASDTTTYFDHYISLDFKLRIFENMNGFIRTDLKSGYLRDEFSLRFFSGYYDVSFKDGLISLFHNFPKFQFTNPSKLFNQNLPLLYDEIDFVYEESKPKLFGKDYAGVYFTKKIFNTSVQSAIVYNKNDYSTTAALRYDTSGIIYPLRIGFTGCFTRGKRWLYSYYTGREWFPDPEKDFNTNNQPWYKGFVENDIISFDLGFSMFKNLLLFSEVWQKNSKLQSYRWNEGIGVDSPSEKYWKLFSRDSVVLGFQQKIDMVKFETGYNYLKTKYHSMLNRSIDQEVQQNKSYIKLLVKLTEKLNLQQGIFYSNYNYSKGFSIAEKYLNYYDFPTWYLKEYIYDIVASSQQYTCPEKDLNVQLHLVYKDLPLMYGRLCFSMYNAENDVITKKDISYYETVAELCPKIYKTLYLQVIPRYTLLNGDVFLSYFLGLNFVFPTAGFISIGSGYLLPYTHNDDIGLFVDARNEKLYNFLTSTREILEAEKKFIDEELYPIILKFQLRF